MKTRIYKVQCLINGEVKIFEVTSHSLIRIIEEFVNNDGEVITIVAKVEEESKSTKMTDKILKEKQVFYNSKYLYYYHLYKQDKITKETFNEITKAIKKMMTKCKDRVEYEKEFEEYKKTLTL